MLPQHIVYKNELNCEYVITLARTTKLPDDDLKRSKHVGVVFSVLKFFKCKLYRCICWLIVEVILRNARCNDEIESLFIRVLSDKAHWSTNIRIHSHLTSALDGVAKFTPRPL